jgi:uncharacterized membrane protein
MQFSKEEEQLIVGSIRKAEQMTSGEIRLYVESICESGNALERAEALFYGFEMNKTRDRNGVIIYLAPVSRQFAIWGDQGIFEKCGPDFWEEEKVLLRRFLQADEPVAGLCAVVESIGYALQHNFPANDEDNPNELSDDIIYG